MNPGPFPPIPPETAKAARAVFGRSSFYLVVGDQVNNLFSGLSLDRPHGWVRKPADLLAMLYMVTIFQFLETLPDHLAVEAVRKRVDWKYALHLPLNSLDMEANRFCEFRKWLLADPSGERNLQELLARLSEIISVIGKQNLSQESSQIVQSVCLYSRLSKVWVSFKDALGALAIKQPQWLREISLPHWYERYEPHEKALNSAYERSEQEVFAQSIGADGFYLLNSISASGIPELAALPEVLALRRVWQEHYQQVEGGLWWKKDACAGCLLPVKGRFVKK